MTQSSTETQISELEKPQSKPLGPRILWFAGPLLPAIILFTPLCALLENGLIDLDEIAIILWTVGTEFLSGAAALFILLLTIFLGVVAWRRRTYPWSFAFFLAAFVVNSILLVHLGIQIDGG